MENVRVNVLVCAGTGCTSNKSGKVFDRFVEALKERGLDKEVKVVKTGCFGQCQKGPIVAIYPDEVFYNKVSIADVDEIIEEHLYKGRVVKRLEITDIDAKTKEKIVDFAEIPFYKRQKRIALKNCGVINPEDIHEYIARDGYLALGTVLETMTPEEVISVIEESKLRGRGGGGFLTGKKWRLAHDQVSDEKYVICNADEGDPGAFMDRSIVEGDPHSIIEALAIAAYAIGANKGYVYTRSEYPLAIQRTKIAIEQATELGLLGDNILGSDFSFHLELRLGAGAFICGEETALIASIEGRRGMPHQKPPHPVQCGVWGKPTVINNVETLANVPQIILNGADWFRSIGTENSPGTKVLALGGKLQNTGMIEVPFGITLRELIYEIGGGCQNNKAFKAVQVGGPGGGCLPEEYLDTPLDFDVLNELGANIDSGSIIGLDEDSCMVDFAKIYIDFIVGESCGKCTPCRIGTKRLLEMLEKITKGEGTLELLDEMEELCEHIKNNSICGLGQNAANPVIATLKHFKDEYIAHVVDKRCPGGVCKELLSFTIDPNLCRKCSKCSRVCPVEAISGVPGQTPYYIDPTKCIKCGTCYNNCFFKAIRRG